VEAEEKLEEVFRNIWIKEFEGFSKLLHSVGQPLRPFQFPVTK
jgi:hypothetical protein